jgi:hypothetical protein
MIQKLKAPLYIFVLLLMASCHNYERTTAESQAIQNGDSALRADSIKAIKGNDEEKAVYQKDLQLKIDSLNARLIKMDSTNAKRKNVNKAKWFAARKQIMQEYSACKLGKRKWPMLKRMYGRNLKLR